MQRAFTFVLTVSIFHNLLIFVNLSVVVLIALCFVLLALRSGSENPNRPEGVHDRLHRHARRNGHLRISINDEAVVQEGGLRRLHPSSGSAGGDAVVVVAIGLATSGGFGNDVAHWKGSHAVYLLIMT
ncbi:hypothetical protein ZWY2020_008190 [Hordeum vulgare]|nr:hypothetical protein ZWY2020_008190 [Hordeum vulgare]